ncbi:hypothetical protein LUZ60_009309 [Juncus effusus]|nr:hypothetical protein LUZ60_009309 [Juncus effusus]
MSFLVGTDSMFVLTRIRGQLQLFSETASASLSSTACKTSIGESPSATCHSTSSALDLKLLAISIILITGILGVSIPLLGRKRRVLRTDGQFFILSKAVAAGVILATGFVHMLNDAEEALRDECLPAFPWRKFPFPGFVAMVAALVTLVADFVCTRVCERREREEMVRLKEEVGRVGRAEEGDEERGEGIEEEEEGRVVPAEVRHVVVSQILELGIVSHSVIIGLSLGVSQSPCTIKPLIGALAFHQFFEGFALGGCISQAQFTNLKAYSMSSFFAITTPLGIGIGISLASFYDSLSPRALVIEGLLDSVSAGILIYMALVDLIAADFLNGKMSGSSVRMQVASYFAIFVGAISMSSLAIWA